MRRVLFFSSVFLAFLCVLVVSSLAFFPWEQAGEYGMGILSKSLAQRGFPLSFDRVEARGRFFPDFVVTNVVLGNMLGGIRVRELVLTPRALQSAVNLGASAELSFRDAEITFGKDGRAAISGGTVWFLLGRKSARIDVIETRGDIKVRGRIVIDPPNRRISGANVELGVADALDAKLGALKGILPLDREKKGLWRWKQGEVS